MQVVVAEGNHRKALQLFSEILAAQPSGAGATAVRLAIGACYLRLAEYDLARLSFERVLRLDPTCAAAWAGRAAVELSAADRDSVAPGVKLLNSAYAEDTSLAPVATALAAAHLLKGDLAAAQAFADQAVRFLFFSASNA
jgi:tetratricopeptide (TPR) repeat protein